MSERLSSKIARATGGFSELDNTVSLLSVRDSKLFIELFSRDGKSLEEVEYKESYFDLSLAKKGLRFVVSHIPYILEFSPHWETQEWLAKRDGLAYRCKGWCVVKVGFSSKVKFYDCEDIVETAIYDCEDLGIYSHWVGQEYKEKFERAIEACF